MTVTKKLLVFVEAYDSSPLVLKVEDVESVVTSEEYFTLVKEFGEEVTECSVAFWVMSDFTCENATGAWRAGQ